MAITIKRKQSKVHFNRLERLRIEETNLRTAQNFIIYNRNDGSGSGGSLGLRRSSRSLGSTIGSNCSANCVSECDEDDLDLDNSVYIGDSCGMALPTVIETQERKDRIATSLKDSVDTYRFLAPIPNSTSYVSMIDPRYISKMTTRAA